MELYQPEFFRLYADACTDHGMMKMDPDRFGVYGHSSFLIHICISHVWFNGHMRLSGTICIHLYDIGSCLHNRSRIFSLYAVGLIVNIRCSRMDFHSVRVHSFRCRHVSRKHFQINLHILGCFPGMGDCICTYHSDSISVLEHFLVTEDRTVPAVAFICGECDKSGDPVLSGNIFIGNDPVYSRHLLCLRGIDPLDPCMGYFCLDQCDLQGILRKGLDLIGSKIPGSGHFCRRRRTGIAGSQDPVIRWLEHKIFFCNLSPQYSGCVHHRIYQRLISGTAAEIPVLIEPFPDFRSGGRGIILQKHFGAHNKARRTESALCAAMCDPGRLQRMKVLQSTYTFDSFNFCIIRHFRYFGNTRAGHFSVHDHIAGSAMSLSAADLTACKKQSVPEHFS